LVWSIEFDPAAVVDLEKIDREIQRRILRYLRERLQTDEDPKRFGKPLRGEKVGLWRYRIGAYRLVCLTDEKTKRILVLRVGHRRGVYED
jgi:mRNA interferase RelE/StbE